MRALRRIDRWVFAPGPAEQLAGLRIGLCTVLALRLTRTVYVSLAGQPAALFRPRSFMHAFGSMPPRAAVLAVQALGLAAATAAAIGARARMTLPLAWACGTFLGGMTTSLGKVVHNDVLLLLAMVPLLPAPVADAWSLDARGRATPPPSSRYGWPARAALVVVAGGYFFAGLAKVVSAGVGWVASGNLRWVMYASSDGAATPNPAALFVADRAWLAHVAAAATLAVELGFPVVLWRARTRPYLIAVAAVLHLGIWMTLRLDYWAQAATVAVVLTDWPGAVRWFRARALPRTARAATG